MEAGLLRVMNFNIRSFSRRGEGVNSWENRAALNIAPIKRRAPNRIGIGTPLEASNVDRRSFKPLLKEAGLRDIRFHDLRHTCATVLLSEGVNPKLVQELLRHADIKLTLGTYSHYLPSMGDQTASARQSALG